LLVLVLDTSYSIARGLDERISNTTCSFTEQFRVAFPMLQ
jgi:hypothetical protein